MHPNTLQHRFLTSLSFYLGVKNRPSQPECLEYARREALKDAQLFLKATEGRQEYRTVRAKAQKLIFEEENNTYKLAG